MPVQRFTRPDPTPLSENKESLNLRIYSDVLGATGPASRVDNPWCADVLNASPDLRLSGPDNLGQIEGRFAGFAGYWMLFTDGLLTSSVFEESVETVEDLINAVKFASPHSEYALKFRFWLAGYDPPLRRPSRSEPTAAVVEGPANPSRKNSTSSANGTKI